MSFCIRIGQHLVMIWTKFVAYCFGPPAN